MIVAAIDDTLLKLPGKLETPENTAKNKERITHKQKNGFSRGLRRRTRALELAV